MRPRVLVISSDAVGTSMAGGGIRAYELARALAPHSDVTLAGLASATTRDLDMHVVTYDLNAPHALRQPIASADVIVAQPQWPGVMRWMKRSGARLIFDMYVPELFEVLESWAGRNPALRSLVASLVTDRLMHAFHIGHHILCASDRQRDLWLGAMLAERIVTPRLLDADPSLHRIIAKVPFGVPDETVARTGAPGLRDRFPDIGLGDPVALWNGGLWGWLDPLTAIRAMAEVAERLPGARLVFMGKATHRQAQAATQEARDLAGGLGLLDRTVFFNDVWVPYADRANWLLDADCAVSAHHEHLETRFAFRTRLLDCFWSGLPIVCTEGDDLADRIELDDLGATARPGDVAGMANAIERVLVRGRASYGPALQRMAADFAWSAVTEPVVQFAIHPEPTPRIGTLTTPRRPGQMARSIGFQAARASLNRVGLTRWPGGPG